MPVKVRCPSCESVLNAPDRARGKAIKCPDCGTRVRVPVGKPAKKVAAPPPSGSVMIANLDLDRLEDTENRICPKCGSEVVPEDIECPNCHVNLATGMLSAVNRAELTRKGPNPKLYYKEFFSSGIAFWKTHKKLVMRLTAQMMGFIALAEFCLFMGLWAYKPLVRYFWFFCAAVAVLIPPGLVWNLHTVILEATMRKKQKLGKYNFDKFLGAALGLKLIFWFVVIAAPLHLLALLFVFLHSRGVGPALMIAAALEGAAVVFASLLFPIMMTHMAMPVTIRGWMLHKMSAPFFRTLPAVLYWCLFLYLLVLPPIACMAAAGVLSGQHIVRALGISTENAAIYRVHAAMENLAKNETPTPEMRDYEKKKEESINWQALFLPAGLLLGGVGLFGASAVFLARTNGLFGYYFMDRLDLETMAPETQYVAVARTLEELESRKGLTWNVVIGGIARLFALGLCLGGSVGMNSGDGFMYGAACGMMITGGISAAVGFFWVMYEAFMDSMLWFGAIQLGWPVSFTVRLLTEMEYSWILSVLPAIIYGTIHWSNAKFASVMMMSGFVYFSTGFAIWSQMHSVVA